MPGELQYVNITDFTGGLNLWRNQFQLSDNESPDMMNVIIDPRVGFYVRAGLQRQNAVDIEDPAMFAPRMARTVLMSGGLSQSFITSSDKIYCSTDKLGTWTDMGVVATAAPHLADFASWGDKTYIATGPDNPTVRQDGQFVSGTNDPDQLLTPGPDWNNDYTVPLRGYGPRAEVLEPHSGYLFYANLQEDLGDGEGSLRRPNRLRWSHPLSPEDFAEDDFLDIETGGGEITALMSFQDHLVIFKTDSMWALYGYDTDSWQLIKMSKDIGVTHPGAIARNETSIFLFSSSDAGAVWGYDGRDVTDLSGSLRPVMDSAGRSPDEVWVGWASRTLYVSLVDGGQRTVYVWDPDVGRGAWMRFEPATDDIGPIMERGDHEITGGPAVFVAQGGASAVVAFDTDLAGVDYIQDQSTPAPYSARYRTGWRDAGTPERRESWRRPRFILSVATATTVLKVNTFQDYDEVEAKRSHTLQVDSSGQIQWRLGGAAEDGGFDWKASGEAAADGANWAAGQPQGSIIRRVQPPQAGRSGLGVCAAVQLEIIADAGSSRWGVDAIVLKHRSRRGTT